jgi:hypothetical protein
MTIDLPFLFGEADEPCEDAFVLRIPKEIRTKQELLSSYAEIGRFPGYFGNNWDAFEELLSDFSWIDKRNIWITHEDLPLSNSEKELRIYLDILRSAIAESRATSRQLFVYFPPGVRDKIVRSSTA